MQQLSKTTLSLAGFQWLFFIFANTIVVPLSVGSAFQLSPEEIAATIRSTFLFTGAASIFQAMFGHKYPLLEGHAGLWWGLVLSLSASASSLGMSYAEIGGSLAAGIILSGLLTIVLAFLGFASVLQKIFNPVVMSVYLFLLSTQLVIIFFKGMLGLSDDNKLNGPVALLSICLVILVIILSVKGKGKISNFAILLGILVGWIAYSLFFPVQQQVQSGEIELFALFPWGSPRLDIGIMLTSFFAGLINMSNSIVAISTADKVYSTQTGKKGYKWSLALTGFHSAVAGVVGLVPYGPYTSSIGFLESTRLYQRLPFIIGGGLFILFGIIPELGAFFSMLPVTVGSAVLFVAYLQLFGTSLKNIQQIDFNARTVYRIALPLLLGICILNMPAEAFAVFPAIIQPLISNGLLVGVMVSIFLEMIGDWDRYKA